jgi:hypothetical protein
MPNILAFLMSETSLSSKTAEVASMAWQELCGLFWTCVASPAFLCLVIGFVAGFLTHWRLRFNAKERRHVAQQASLVIALVLDELKTVLQGRPLLFADFRGRYTEVIPAVWPLVEKALNEDQAVGRNVQSTGGTKPLVFYTWLGAVAPKEEEQSVHQETQPLAVSSAASAPPPAYVPLA